MRIFLILFPFFILSCSKVAYQYPSYWWRDDLRVKPAWWEIMPSAGKVGESVILSKRNDLGSLSNFAATPFVFEGKKYASLEGFWQAMKYPEMKKDPRSVEKFPHSRSEVEQMSAFKAKQAGDDASKIMKKLKINWVSYKGEQFPYKVNVKGRHYQLIRQAMVEKFKQNANVRDILLKTGELVLLPDHKTSPDVPPAWKYNEIWMGIRRDYMEGKL